MWKVSKSGTNAYLTLRVQMHKRKSCEPTEFPLYEAHITVKQMEDK